MTTYFELLVHWNRTINLTSLSNPDEAVDRLLLEPVAAAAHLPHGEVLIDLGSGGGSPAVPLALATGAVRLVMVESRSRKAAFLREVLRELGLPGAVESARFEDVSARPALSGAFGLVSVRAVRLDAGLFSSVDALVASGGQVALFHNADVQGASFDLPPSLQWRATVPLIPATRSALTVLSRS